MAYEDKTLTCMDCGETFVHTAEDQARYAERGFTNDPKRCRPCREKRKAGATPGGDSADRVLVCSDCGKDFVHSAKDQAYYAERGFRNDPKRCRDCREKHKEKMSAARKRAGGGSGRPRPGGPPGARGDRPGARGDRPGGRGDRPTGRGASASSAPPAKTYYQATCSECGASTTVPFKPLPGRPVYCRDCFRAMRRDQ